MAIECTKKNLDFYISIHIDTSLLFMMNKIMTKKLVFGLWFFLIFWVWTFIFLGNQGNCTAASCIETTAWTTWTILDYSPEDMANALSKKHKIWLLFKANRCGSCKVLQEELTTKGIPAGSILFLVDFDNAKELRATYNINNMDTFITVNENLQETHRENPGNYETIYQLLQN